MLDVRHTLAVYWRDAVGDYRGMALAVSDGDDVMAAAKCELEHRNEVGFSVVAFEPLELARREKATYMHAVPHARSTDFFMQRALHLEGRRKARSTEEMLIDAIKRLPVSRSTPFMEHARHMEARLAQQLLAPVQCEVPEVPFPYNVVNDVEPPNNTPRGLLVMSAIGFRLGNTWSPQ